jgi:hypothetical protein
MAHLAWIPAAAAVGFLAAFLFGDLLTLPIDLYYLVYFACVLGFAAAYVRLTDLDVRSWLSRRLFWALALGIVVGLVLMQGVLARPATARLSGPFLWWALLWRGVVYGFVDGVLLFSIPWIVVWRAFDAEHAAPGRKLAAGFVASAAIFLVTTAYHLGYRDFRSARIVQPNIGSAIASAATLLSANPIGSAVSHIVLHVTAVAHSPATDLFLPPHRERGSTGLQSPPESRPTAE